MLRVLRPSFAPAVWRRLVATLLAALVLVAGAEPLLAEAHDGDAPRADVPAVAVAAAAYAAPAALPLVTPARHAPAKRAPSHAVHVCHCAHAHGGLFVPEPFVLTTRTRRTGRRVAARSDRLPPSPRPEPRLRPPLFPTSA